MFDAPLPEEPRISRGDSRLMRAVDAHLVTHFGRDSFMVLHEIISPTVHVDVYIVEPSERFPFVRLLTSGLSELPMTVPAGFPASPHAELTMALPVSWGRGAPQDSWPIQLLRQLARLPHEARSHLWYGHRLRNGNPPQPFAPDTRLCAAVIVPPVDVPPGFDTIEIEQGRVVTVLGVLPIYPRELEYLRRRGYDTFFRRLAAKGYTDVVTRRRPSYLQPAFRAVRTRSRA